MAPLNEGAGYIVPKPWDRHPGHRPIDWYQTDYDDSFHDPDAEFVDPLPTLRHREVPS